MCVRTVVVKEFSEITSLLNRCYILCVAAALQLAFVANKAAISLHFANFCISCMCVFVFNKYGELLCSLLYAQEFALAQRCRRAASRSNVTSKCHSVCIVCVQA